MTAPQPYPQQPYGQQPYGPSQYGQPYGQPPQFGFSSPGQLQDPGTANTALLAGALVCGTSSYTAVNSVILIINAIYGVAMAGEAMSVVYLFGTILVAVAGITGIISGIRLFHGIPGTSLVIMHGVSAFLSLVIALLTSLIPSGSWLHDYTESPDIFVSAYLPHFLILLAGIFNVVTALRAAPRRQAPQNIPWPPVQSYGYPS